MTSASPSLPRRPYAPRMPLAARREQLLDAALDIALERGFHAVTVDAVARACGVTRPVVYGAFDDRAALLSALGDRAEGQTLQQLAAVFPALPGPDDDVDPDDLLLAGVTAYLRAVASDPRTWRVVLLPPEGAPAELVERVDRHRGVLLEQLRVLLDWGLARRGGPAVEPELFARAVFTLSEEAARLLLDDPGRWSLERFTAFTITLLAGLARSGAAATDRGRQPDAEPVRGSTGRR